MPLAVLIIIFLNLHRKAIQPTRTRKGGGVESVDGPARKKRATDLNENDLIQFKIQLDKHIEEWNDSLDVDNVEDLICIMAPVMQSCPIKVRIFY